MNTDPESGPVPVFRAPMRARDRDASAFGGADCGVAAGLVGTGDRLGSPPAGLDEAIAAAGAEHGAKAARMLDRFAGLPDGVFVWTQTAEDGYRLGRITGPWRYDADACAEAGMHHVRPARWLPDELPAAAVPAGVVHTFARGGRNFQRINDDATERDTAAIWLEAEADG